MPCGLSGFLHGEANILGDMCPIVVVFCFADDESLQYILTIRSSNTVMLVASLVSRAT